MLSAMVIGIAGNMTIRSFGKRTSLMTIFKETKRSKNQTVQEMERNEQN